MGSGIGSEHIEPGCTIPRPIQNSYWVIPGRFLAGEYPGALVTDAARVRLRRFLEVGINLFVDLTEEGDLELYGALLDRLTHHCHIMETGKDRYRFKNSTTKEKTDE